MSAEGRKKLTELLTKHQGAFARGPDDLGRTHLVQHEIRTPPDLRLLAGGDVQECPGEVRVYYQWGVVFLEELN